MIILKVPYAEKDQAKALGARWNNERKVWYVPDGAVVAPFKQWMGPGQSTAHVEGPAGKAPAKAAGAAGGAKPGRVDSATGKTSIGAFYIDVEHGCNPFADCAECRPKLESSGWLAQHALVQQLVVSLKAPR